MSPNKYTRGQGRRKADNNAEKTVQTQIQVSATWPYLHLMVKAGLYQLKTLKSDTLSTITFKSNCYTYFFLFPYFFNTCILLKCLNIFKHNVYRVIIFYYKKVLV